MIKHNNRVVLVEGGGVWKPTHPAFQPLFPPPSLPPQGRQWDNRMASLEYSFIKPRLLVDDSQGAFSVPLF